MLNVKVSALCAAVINLSDTSNQHGGKEQVMQRKYSSWKRVVCVSKHMMDCHLIQPYHCISICFTNQGDVIPHKLLDSETKLFR